MNLLDRFRMMDPVRQLLLALVGALLLALVLASAYFLLLRKPYAVLLSGLRPADAAAVVAELDKKKTPYRLEDAGSTILVPRDLVDGARLNVAADGLPSKGAVGFELFNKSDMGLTEFAQRINYQRALQGELARTIMTMRGVDAARVHLVLAEASVFRADRRPSKASVTITPQAGAVLSPGMVAGVQELVAAAAPDLAAQDVVVLNERGEVVSSAPAPPRLALVGDTAALGLEADYAARLTSALRTVYQGRVQVTVSVGGGQAGAGGAIGGGLNEAPVRVVVVLLSPPSPDLERRIRGAAISVLGLDPNRGDSIVVATNAAAWSGPATPAAPAASRAAEPAPPPLAPSVPGWWIQAGLALLVVVAGALMLRARRGQQVPPSPSGRDAFAARLRGMLDEEGAGRGRTR